MTPGEFASSLVALMLLDDASRCPYCVAKLAANESIKPDT